MNFKPIKIYIVSVICFARLLPLMLSMPQSPAMRTLDITKILIKNIESESWMQSRRNCAVRSPSRMQQKNPFVFNSWHPVCNVYPQRRKKNTQSEHENSYFHVVRVIRRRDINGSHHHQTVLMVSNMHCAVLHSFFLLMKCCFSSFNENTQRKTITTIIFIDHKIHYVPGKWCVIWNNMKRKLDSRTPYRTNNIRNQTHAKRERQRKKRM